jgi:VanZ family protein
VIRILPLRAALALGYMAGVFALSSIPQAKLRALGMSDLLWNLGHVPLFAGLAWVTLWGVLGPWSLRAIWVGAVCVAFALGDELHQTLVPGRTFSWADVGADTAGIGIGLALGLWRWPDVASRKGRSAA